MRLPAMRLNNADFPTFGLPTMANKPDMAQAWGRAPARERQKPARHEKAGVESVHWVLKFGAWNFSGIWSLPTPHAIRNTRHAFPFHHPKTPILPFSYYGLL